MVISVQVVSLGPREANRGCGHKQHSRLEHRMHGQGQGELVTRLTDTGLTFREALDSDHCGALPRLPFIALRQI